MKCAVLLAALLLVGVSSLQAEENDASKQNWAKNWASPSGNLGQWQHDCHGNVKKCNNGLSLTFRYTAANLGNTVTKRTIFSSGGQNPISSGFVFTDNGDASGRHSFVLASGEKEWEVDLHLKRGLEMHFVATWNPNGALKLFVNGAEVAQAEAKTRFAAEYRIDPYPAITIGYRNDEDASNKVNVGVKDLFIWEKTLNTEEIAAAKGDFAPSESAILAPSAIPKPVLKISLDKASMEIGETAALTVSGDFPLGTVLSAEFGDNAPLRIIESGVITYTWRKEGRYTINVTASLDEVSVSQYVTMEIQPESHHVPVQFVQIIAFPSTEKMAVDVELAVYGGPVIECKVEFGDGTEAEIYRISEAGKIINNKHKFAEEGMYSISAHCKNEFGEMQKHTSIIVRDVITTFAPSEVIKIMMHEELKLDIPPQHVDKLKLRVTLDGTDLQFKETGNHIILSPGFVTCVGEHRMSIFSGTAMLHSFALIAEMQMNNVEFTPAADVIHVEPNTDVDFSISIKEQGRFNIEWDFGEGPKEIITAADLDAEKVVFQKKRYAKSGTYKVNVKAANMVDDFEITKTVVVEERIASVEFNTKGQVYITEPITLNVVVDGISQVPAEFSAVFNIYEDGKQIETIEKTFTKTKPEPQTFSHEHKFEKYAKYEIEAVVGNGIKKFTNKQDILMGEEISRTYVHSINSRVTVGEPVLIRLESPSGSPLTFVIDFGDGKEKAYLYTKGIPEPRQKRSADTIVEGSKLIVRAGDKIEIPQNLKTIEIEYRYSEPGSYPVTVNVKNPFGEKSFTMCPPIYVGKDVDENDECGNPIINFQDGIPEDTSEINPHTVFFSEDVDFQPEVKVHAGCKQEKTLGYSWKLFKIANTIDSLDQNCVQSELYETPKNSTEGLPASHTLDFGLYQASFIAYYENNTAKNSRKDIFFKIEQTPLKASLMNGNETTVRFFDNMTINIEDSRDPDAIDGYQGVEIYVFCYKGKQPKTLMRLPAESKINESTVVFESKGKVPLKLADFGECFTMDLFKEGGNNFWYDGNTEIKILMQKISGSEPVYLETVVVKGSRSNSFSQKINVDASGIIDLNDLDRLDELLNGDPNMALNIISASTGVLNSGTIGGTENEDADSVKNKKTAVRGKFVNCIDRIAGPPNEDGEDIMDKDMMAKSTGALDGVTNAADEVDPDTQGKSANAVGSMAGQMGSKLAEVDKEGTKDIGKSMLGAVGNTQGANKHTAKPAEDPRLRALADAEITDEEREKMEDPLYWIMKYDDPTIWNPFDHPCEIKMRVEYAEEQKQLEEKRAKEAERDMSLKAAGASGPIADTIGGKMGEGEPEAITTPNLKMKLMKADPSALANNTASEDEDAGGFKMPNPGSIFGDTNQTMNSAEQENTNNPFAFSDSAALVKSKVQALEFKDNSGKAVVVKDTDEPIQIMAPRDLADIPVKKNFTYLTNTKGKFQIHSQILTSNDSSLHIALQPYDDSQKWEIRVRRGNRTLNETDYDFREVLPRNLRDTMSEEEVQALEKSGKDIELKNSFMISNTELSNDTYYIGLRLISGAITLPFKPENLTFSMAMWQSGCRYWDTTAETWKGDGCHVGPKSTAAATQCLCNHLTSFGGDGFVAPNTIDFSKAFANFSVADNPVTFSVVVSCIVLYLLCLVWARKQDQKDLFKWAAHPMEDNMPTDNYHYLVTVNTGAKKNAGTASKVRFVLTGEYADTGVRKLSDGKRSTFIQGSIANYVLTVDDCLGPLTYLRIWHDNSGKGKAAGWHLDNIQMQDLQTGEKFCFLCDRWLAVEEDDGLVERILPVSSAEDLTNFKHMFSTTARRNLSDGHLWYSVFSRPTRSNFTRCQRITCCVSLMFLTMIANAMFYGQDDIKPAFEIVIGPIIINSTTLQISIYGTLVTMPASMALLTIFKKAKPKESIIGPANMDAATKVKHTRKYQWKKLSGDQQVFKMEKRTGLRGMLDDFKEKRKRKKYENDMPEDDFEKRFAEEQNKNKKKKKGKQSFWPHWTLYIAYFIAFCSIFVSGFFVILYSMQWGREKADGWMTTFLLSIFQNVIVVQPVKIMFLAAFFAAVIKKPKEFEPEDDDDDNSEVKQAKKRHRATHKRNIDETDPEVKAIMDARLEENKNMKPLDLKALEVARKKRMTEVAIEGILKEIGFYLLFLFILMFLAYQTRDPKGNMMWNVVRNNFVDTSSPAWHDTSSTDKIYEFLENNLIPNLYRGPWYNGKTLEWRDRLTTAEWYFNRIGPARIRQMRVKKDTCKPHKEMAHLFDFCRDEYNWDDDDTKPYDEVKGWRAPYKFNETYGKLTKDQKEDVIKEENSPWVYKDSIMLKSAPFFGKLNNYKGGGYVFTLDAHTAEGNLEKLGLMKEMGWMDPHTRAVFIEFTLYNANKNLFASVTLLAEIDSMGGISHMESIKVFRLHSYVGAVGTLVMIGQLIYAIFIITFAVKEVKKMIKLRCEYFKSFWNLMEFLVLLLSLIGVGMYIMRAGFATLALKMLQEEKCANPFVNFNTIALWDETYVTILAMLCFVATIKFLRLLRFNKRIALLSSTLSRSVTDLKLFMIMFGIVFLAYSQASYLVFGAFLGSYSGFLGSIQTLLALLLGDFDFSQLEGANAILGPIFFFTFMVFVYMYLMTMFMAILNDAYADCQAINDGMENELEICDYLYGKLCKVMGWNE